MHKWIQKRQGAAQSLENLANGKLQAAHIIGHSRCGDAINDIMRG
jgi:hypothetical protein